MENHHGGTETRRKDAVERSGQREIGDQAHRHLSGVLSSIVPMIRCPDDPITRSSSVPLCLRGGLPRCPTRMPTEQSIQKADLVSDK